jgi:inner membrane protein
MATVYTHAMVGVSLAYLCTRRRTRWVYWLVAALLPVIADLDTLMLAPSISVRDHRGFTHSLAFSLALGLTTTIVLGWYLRMGFWRLVVLFSVIAASHGILDLFTTAGNGVALWWPISDVRIGPWGPIPVADLALDWPNPNRSRAVRAELLYIWLPLSAVIVAVAFWRHLPWRQTNSVTKV